MDSIFQRKPFETRTVNGREIDLIWETGYRPANERAKEMASCFPNAIAWRCGNKGQFFMTEEDEPTEELCDFLVDCANASR